MKKPIQGKCPQCRKPLDSFIVEQVPLNDSQGILIDTGYVFICPNPKCHSVISGSFEVIDDMDKIHYDTQEILRIIKSRDFASRKR